MRGEDCDVRSTDGGWDVWGIHCAGASSADSDKDDVSLDIDVRFSVSESVLSAGILKEGILPSKTESTVVRLPGRGRCLYGPSRMISCEHDMYARRWTYEVYSAEGRAVSSVSTRPLRSK